MQLCCSLRCSCCGEQLLQCRSGSSCSTGGAERRYPKSKVRSGGSTLWSSLEVIPRVQVKGNANKTVGTERASEDRQPQSQKTSQSDHMDHSFVWFSETKTCHVGLRKMAGSWWKRLTECGWMEKGMANCFSILSLRTPWTAWKGKKIGQWKMNSTGW